MQYVELYFIFYIIYCSFSVFNFNSNINFHFLDFVFILNAPFKKPKIQVLMYYICIMSLSFLRHGIHIHISRGQTHSPAKQLQDSYFFSLAIMNTLNIKFLHSSFPLSYINYLLTYLLYLLTYCLTLNTWPNDYGLFRKLDVF